MQHTLEMATAVPPPAFIIQYSQYCILKVFLKNPVAPGLDKEMNNCARQHFLVCCSVAGVCGEPDA